MKYLNRVLFFILFVYAGSTNSIAQALKINELMSSNSMEVYDEDGDTPDWIEIINTGNNDVNLADYYLSDNPEEFFKWQIPDFSLSPNQPFLIYASGKDRLQVPRFWYTIIDAGQDWKYIIPTSEIEGIWKFTSFDDSSWATGPSGIGYGDNDDKTILPSGTASVFMRKKFTITDAKNIETLWLNMDFDDGFIAYINGIEVSRIGLGEPGTPVAYNKAASSHEAEIYQNGKPEGFNISNYIYLLKDNENTLAIQVHNAGASSSDMSAIPFLSVGYKNKADINAPVSEYLEVPELFPHANFKLSSTGETVSITYKNGMVSDSISFGIIPGNFSFGRTFSDPSKWGFFQTPTPGLQNDAVAFSDVVKGEIQFSVPEMFLTVPAYLSLFGTQPGEEIRYTENGMEPTMQSTKYEQVIALDKTKVIRARIFKPDAIPGKIASRTYIFAKKPTLPVVSVSTSPENLWDNETGIYVLGDSYEDKNPYYGANFWEDWEKPASIEMMGEDGKLIFSMNCGIKIFGAWSRAHPNKSLSVFFRKEYGDPVLENVQLFKSKPINSFKSLVLRNSGNDYSYTKFRDGMMTSLVSNMDIDIAAFQPVVMYLNGEYWGLINLREKINENYLENNFDVKADEVDILESNGVIVEGNNDHYNEMLAFIESNSMVVDANFEVVAGKMDVSNFIDYQLSEIYFDNRDWPGNNIKLWHPQNENGKWRWLMYDTDFGFGIYNEQAYQLNTLDFATEENGPNWPNPPWSTFLLRKLLENLHFRNLFVNRFADMLNTTFAANEVIQHIDSIADLIEPEIPDNYKRWYNPGINKWQNNVQIMRNFALQRVNFMRNHILQKFSLPKINDVTISIVPAPAGNVQLNSLKITGSTWKGKYFENVPVALAANSFAGYKFRSWEVDGVIIQDKTIELNLKSVTNIRVLFEESEDDGKTIVINEINYNSPIDNVAGDWVEIYNWGNSDIDISRWIFKDNTDDHGFVIPENSMLKSKEYLVLCRNIASFNLVHPDVLNLLGEFDFGLSGSADGARLFDSSGTLVDEVTFNSEIPWPAEPNGTGPTLELLHYSYDNTDPASWNPSLMNLGTPGRENSISTGTNPFIVNSSEKQLKVYPNPFVNVTRIAVENNGFDPLKIEIYSIDGQLVFKKNPGNSEYIWRGENNAGEKLQPGIYICKVQVEGEMFTSKIILGR